MCDHDNPDTPCSLPTEDFTGVCIDMAAVLTMAYVWT